jgi:DNA-binding transcriptional regulator YdaS (Cro superfamily)
MDVSANSVQLLRAACEIAGGTRALAERLGIRESVLLIFMEDRRELPDELLLRAVDIILAERESRPVSENSRLSDAAEILQNPARENRAAFGAGDD